MSTSTMHERRPSQLQTLVLNADARPLSTWPLSLISGQDAVHALLRDRVIALEEWEGAFFRSPSVSIAVPKVVMLRAYAPIAGSPKFCRRSILLRDRYRCQYCGEAFPSEQLTFDHVRPKSEGGKTEWTNILAACERCNGIKKNNHANHSGRRGVIRQDGKLRPLKEPRVPTSAELLRAGLEFLPADVRENFGDFLYWNAELRP